MSKDQTKGPAPFTGCRILTPEQAAELKVEMIKASAGDEPVALTPFKPQVIKPVTAPAKESLNV